MSVTNSQKGDQSLPPPNKHTYINKIKRKVEAQMTMLWYIKTKGDPSSLSLMTIQ